MKELSTGATPKARALRLCSLCGAEGAPVCLPFAVGRQDSPPYPLEHRFMGIGPRRKKFVQRYRWIWHTLWLCRGCGGSPPSDKLWSAIHRHPSARDFIKRGYSETRLDSGFTGKEGDVTSSEETL